MLPQPMLRQLPIQRHPRPFQLLGGPAFVAFASREGVAEAAEFFFIGYLTGRGTLGLDGIGHVISDNFAVFAGDEDALNDIL